MTCVIWLFLTLHIILVANLHITTVILAPHPSLSLSTMLYIITLGFGVVLKLQDTKIFWLQEMRWIIAGVKCTFQPRQVDRARPTSSPQGGGSLPRWRWEGRQAWCGAPHDEVSARLWTALVDCGRALISVCQGLSASVMFTPQVCWLLADCSAKTPSSFSWELTWSANRNPPTARNPHQTPTITALPHTHTHAHTLLFLTKFTCYTLQFLELHPSTHLSTTLFTCLEGMWVESLLDSDAVHSSKVTIFRLFPSVHHSSYS